MWNSIIKPGKTPRKELEARVELLENRINQQTKLVAMIIQSYINILTEIGLVKRPEEKKDVEETKEETKKEVSVDNEPKKD